MVRYAATNENKDTDEPLGSELATDDREDGYLLRIGILISAVAVIATLYVGLAIHPGFDGWWFFGLGVATILYAFIVPFGTLRMIPALIGAVIFALFLLVWYRWLWIWSADLFQLVAGTGGNAGIRGWLLASFPVWARALIGAVIGGIIGLIVAVEGKRKETAFAVAVIGAFLLIWPFWLSLNVLLAVSVVLHVTWAILLWRRASGGYTLLLPILSGFFLFGYIGWSYSMANWVLNV